MIHPKEIRIVKNGKYYDYDEVELNGLYLGRFVDELMST